MSTQGRARGTMVLGISLPSAYLGLPPTARESACCPVVPQSVVRHSAVRVVNHA